MKKPALLLAVTMLAAPAVQAADPAFAAQANALCRTIIDARDVQTFTAAEEGSLDLFIAHMREESPPSAETAGELSQLLQAVNADLQATIDQLRTLPSSPELDAFLAYGQSRIDVNTIRIGFLADLDNWQWPMADTLSTNQYDYIAGMAALGFTDRDCAYVFGSRGNPPELANFISTVAPACSVAFDDLVVTDLDTWRDRNLSAMLASREGKPQDPEAVPALRSLASAWKNAAHAFRLVDSRIAEKPPLWEETIAILYERARIFEDRADALQYRDADAVWEAFANRIGVPDFRQLGLGETSCMALAKLM